MQQIFEFHKKMNKEIISSQVFVPVLPLDQLHLAAQTDHEYPVTQSSKSKNDIIVCLIMIPLVTINLLKNKPV